MCLKVKLSVEEFELEQCKQVERRDGICYIYYCHCTLLFCKKCIEERCSFLTVSCSLLLFYVLGQTSTFYSKCVSSVWSWNCKAELGWLQWLKLETNLRVDTHRLSSAGCFRRRIWPADLIRFFEFYCNLLHLATPLLSCNTKGRKICSLLFPLFKMNILSLALSWIGDLCIIYCVFAISIWIDITLNKMKRLYKNEWNIWRKNNSQLFQQFRYQDSLQSV